MESIFNYIVNFFVEPSFTLILNEINSSQRGNATDLTLISTTLENPDFDPNVTHHGYSLLDHAAINGLASICEIIIATGRIRQATVDHALSKVLDVYFAESQTLATSLMRCAELLLHSGAKVEANAISIFFPILYYQDSFARGIKIIKLLLQFGATLNFTEEEHGQPPLYIATTLSPLENSLQLVDLLLTYHVNPELSESTNMETALMNAVNRGSVELCKLLLSHGADITMENKLATLIDYARDHAIQQS